MRRALLLPLLFTAVAGPATAHPHLFVEARAEVVLAEDKALEAIRVEWVFDEAYSLYAKDGLGIDADGDGLLTDEDRETLRSAHIDEMEEFSWFTYLRDAGNFVPLAPPSVSEADMIGDRLVVRFTIAPKETTSFANGTLKLSDPTFYVAISLPPENLTYAGPAECRLEYAPPENTVAFNSVIGMNLGEGQARAFGVTFASDISLACD